MVRACPHPPLAAVAAELGQATVELMALLPLVAVLGALLWQAVVAGQAIWFAGSAARAAARASAIGADARAAARRVLPTHLEPGSRCGGSAGATASASRSRFRRSSAPPAWGASPRAPAYRTRRDDRDRARTGEAGQASVELVALAPLVVLVVLSAAQLLAAGAARELAGHAAEAAAVALLQGSDPRAAARDAVPGWSRDRMAVRVDGRKVRVRLLPASPIPSSGRAARGPCRGRRGTGGAVSAVRSLLEHFVAPPADCAVAATTTSSPPTKDRIGRARNPRRARLPVSRSWRRPRRRSRSAPRWAWRSRGDGAPPSSSCASGVAGSRRPAVVAGARDARGAHGSRRPSVPAGIDARTAGASCSCDWRRSRRRRRWRRGA